MVCRSATVQEVTPPGVIHDGYATLADAEQALGLTPIVHPVRPSPSVNAAKQALIAAEREGIEVPLGTGSIRMLCGDRDRALFASALTLYRTHEDLLPDEAAKESFRGSMVTFSDASGQPHELTVQQARQLLVVYGAMYQAIWAAAAESNGSPPPEP
jgi:hypothetical protein